MQEVTQKAQMGSLAPFNIYFLSIFIVRLPLTAPNPILFVTLSKSMLLLLTFNKVWMSKM